MRPLIRHKKTPAFCVKECVYLCVCVCVCVYWSIEQAFICLIFNPYFPPLNFPHRKIPCPLHSPHTYNGYIFHQDYMYFIIKKYFLVVSAFFPPFPILFCQHYGVPYRESPQPSIWNIEELYKWEQKIVIISNGLLFCFESKDHKKRLMADHFKC